MAIIPRPINDIVLSNMVAALQAFEETQTAQDPLVHFSVERDRLMPPDLGKLPLVNLWSESITSRVDGSSAKGTLMELHRINADCYASGDDENLCNDKAVMNRVYYLAEQVKYGLYKLVNADFGLPAGLIARKKWPSWTLFQNDLRLPEVACVAGRWVIEFEAQWSPEDILGTPLDSIAWSGLYAQGGN